MNNEVINLIEYKSSQLEQDADSSEDKVGQATKKYRDTIKQLRRDITKRHKQMYRDLMRYIDLETINIKKEPIFDWKRRKSTL